MKKKVAALLLIMCMAGSAVTGCQKGTNPQTTETVGSAAGTEVQTTDGQGETAGEENLLVNGNFSNGTEHWGVFLDQGGDGVLAEMDGVGTYLVKKAGSVNYSNQLYYDGFSLQQGGVYKLSFDMSSTMARPFEVRIQLNGGDYHAYTEHQENVAEDIQTFSYEFTMEEETDLAPRLCFNIGAADGLSDGEHTITLDNVSLVLLDGSNVSEESAGAGGCDINVNQVGYLPNAQKTAVVRNHEAGSAFTVLDENGAAVYEGTLSDEKKSEPADETVCIADFSELESEGVYTVSCGEEVSYPFEIKEGVYDELLKDTIRLMYLQRCGCELTEDLAGKFAHPVCHDTEAVIYGTDEKKDVSGGWHDAGDYGKYVVTGAQTAMDLMLCYETNPSYWDSFNLDIPESNDSVADILDETRYELDWMLKMQDEKSGGAYHKVSGYNFPAFVMPEEETTELVIAPVSTTATGDFAAVMAKASQVYKKIDADFAKKCLHAAENAWGYLEKNDGNGGFQNPSDIATGEYPDESDTDERFWAAVELFKATGDSKYQTYFESVLKDSVPLGYGWIEMGTYGELAYLSMDESKQNPDLVKKIKDTIIAQADVFVTTANEEGYGCVLPIEGYNWGSNLGVCNDARQLLLAKEFTGNEEYAKTALRQLDYLLGENSLSTSFVTGYGTLCSKDVHHRPSVAQGEAIRGMLVGGPNSGIEDSYAATVLQGCPPAKCYVDHQQSYSTNEVTIYWNSPLACLLTDLLKK